MAETCPCCGSEDIRHEHRPDVGAIDVICGYCRHGIRLIQVKRGIDENLSKNSVSGKMGFMVFCEDRSVSMS
jgi:hypothetical protein